MRAYVGVGVRVPCRRRPPQEGLETTAAPRTWGRENEGGVRGCVVLTG